VTADTKRLPYRERLHLLHRRIEELKLEAPHLHPHLRRIPWVWINNIDELDEYDALNLASGCEGTILRDPNAAHKEGRSGKKPILWRIKRFADFEFRVHTIIEGDANLNEAQVNELGNQFRSSHQANKVPNGMVGAMLGTVIGVVTDPSTGEVLFNEGDEVRVGAGRLSHVQRKHYFDNQDDFKSRIHKGKFFPKGIKDKLRFPTWQTFRDAADIS
jgi:DNA ligase-1